MSFILRDLSFLETIWCDKHMVVYEVWRGGGEVLEVPGLHETVQTGSLHPKSKRDRVKSN